MTIALDEANPYAQGFDAYYSTEIVPELERMEGRRKTAARVVILLCTLAGLGILSFLLGTWLESVTGVSSDTFGFGGFAVMFVSIGGAVLTHKWAHGAFKEVLVGRTCDFLGLSFASRKFDFPLDRFREVDLVPRYDKAKLEDRIAGEHEGVPFELCEARLERKKEDRDRDGDRKIEYVEVFSGLVLVYRFPKRFEGRTVVVPDFTWLGNALGGLSREGERVTLEDVTFERQFEVYSTDQVEARYLLTPRFMERLTDLASRFGNPRTLSVAFDGTDLLITVRGNEDRFEGGGIFKSFAERERAQTLLTELSLVFEIVDVLNLSSKTSA